MVGCSTLIQTIWDGWGRTTVGRGRFLGEIVEGNYLLRRASMIESIPRINRTVPEPRTFVSCARAGGGPGVQCSEKDSCRKQRWLTGTHVASFRAFASIIVVATQSCWPEAVIDELLDHNDTLVDASIAFARKR